MAQAINRSSINTNLMPGQKMLYFLSHQNIWLLWWLSYRMANEETLVQFPTGTKDIYLPHLHHPTSYSMD